MPRKPRTFKPGYSYHITTRCNNREFKLSRRECREVFLYAIKKALNKFNFQLYALCIMSNHVHYLIEPTQPKDLPKIMHFLNWYTAMCFNRMLRRTGHFWEKRYYTEPNTAELAINETPETPEIIAAAPTATATIPSFPSFPQQPTPRPTVMPNRAANYITASQAPSDLAELNLAYALGTLGYDFGSEARRDSFKQLMPGVQIDGTAIPANPYDARQMVDYLGDNPSEAKSLIWTLNLELTPIYAIEPGGAFARDVYAILQELLSGQIQPEDSENYVERVSIPGVLSGRSVKLFSGQVVPVIEVPNTRGLYGWKVNTLVQAAIQTVQAQATEAQEESIRRTLGSFLSRIYYDLRNLGTTSQDRALNFASTNAFQAASTFAEAVATGMELDSITVEKSPFCRLDSDCWDVKLKFFDPENSRRAKKLFRFTIDVSDIIPVTLGEVRSWSTPY
ncbi:MAG: PatA/PatG family cyanobactin maturation protease [Trichormus sp.]